MDLTVAGPTVRSSAPAALESARTPGRAAVMGLTVAGPTVHDGAVTAPAAMAGLEPPAAGRLPGRTGIGEFSWA
jgi:hypothetical protein